MEAPSVHWRGTTELNHDRPLSNRLQFQEGEFSFTPFTFFWGGSIRPGSKSTNYDVKRDDKSFDLGQKKNNWKTEKKR